MPAHWISRREATGVRKRLRGGCAACGAEREREEGGLAHKEDHFLAVAQVVKPQGRKGEVAAEILSDVVARFESLRRVFLENPGAAPIPVEVENTWLHKGRIVFKFAGVETIGQALRLKRLHVLIPREERVKLPANSFYVWELVNCQVLVQREGLCEPVGRVTNVERLCGTDLLHVATPRGEVLIPLAAAICKQIDVESKTVVIDPPEGLLDLNLPSHRGRSCVSSPRQRRPI